MLAAQKQGVDKSGVAACFGGKSVAEPLQMIQHELPCRTCWRRQHCMHMSAALPHLCPHSVSNQVALSICCLMDHIWHCSLG